MGKMKEKQSENWKPSIIKNDSFISKNKKRKEKRLSKNITVQKEETGEFIPVKKSALGAKNQSPNAGMSLKSKKGNAFLSTSLPVKENKKPKMNTLNSSTANIKSTKSASGKKIVGILSNPNTPKKNKKESVSFIDSGLKSKNSITNINQASGKKQKRKQVAKANEDSGDESDVSSVNSVTDFLDAEASEGEEVEDGFYGEVSDSDDENSLFDSNDSDVESDSENNDDDEKSDLSTSGIEEDDSGAKENEQCESNIKTPLKNTPSKNANQKQQTLKQDNKKQKGTVEKLIKGKQQTPAEKNKEAKQNTNLKTKQQKAAEGKQDKKSEINDTLKQDKTDETKQKKPQTHVDGEVMTPSKKKPDKKEKTETKPKKPEQNKNELGKAEKKQIDKKEISRPSDHVGFIRNLDSKITSDQIKSELSKKLDAKNILQITLVKNRKNRSRYNAFVYVNSEESLEKLLDQEFKYEDQTFKVDKSKPNVKDAVKFVAFLPRVPTSIKKDVLKNSIEAEVGVGKVLNIKEKRVFEKLQTRNVLVNLSDLETLKKLVYKGGFKVDKETVVVREAVEAGVQIPMYRAVFADISQDMTEEVLKNAIESTIGKNTVLNIRFSFRKKSFAFVTFKTSEAQQKALATGGNIGIEGSNIRVLEFRQRLPSKRANLSEEEKTKKAEKKKRKMESEGNQQDQPSPKKQKKLEKSTDQSEKKTSDESPTQVNQKKKRRRKPKKPASPAVSGEVKATKNPKKVEKQKGILKETNTVQPDKATPLKKKIEEKQASLKKKVKNKKNKNKVEESV